MKDSEISFFDYPLSDTEVVGCMAKISSFAEYMFGPAETSKSPFSRTESMYNSAYYFRLSRKIISLNEALSSCVDLDLFIPFQYESRPSVTNNIETNDSPTTYDGFVTSFSANFHDSRLITNHGTGRLVVVEIADVELEVIEFTDQEPIDPAAIGGVAMLSDYMALCAAFTDQQ